MADAELEEYKRLEAVIADVEKLVTASPQGASPLLLTFIENARKQLESLDRKIKEKEKAAQQEQQVAIQAAVDRETALNASEKETYGGFLKEDFFTKADFGRLESFYDKSWDKLSESGKDEMSHRVWEGIRKNEFTFHQLPSKMQDKETERAYTMLKHGGSEASQIPKIDRDDFFNSYEGGDKDKAKEILERKTFRDNMFIVAPSTERKSVSVLKEKESDREQIEQVNKTAIAQETSVTPVKSGGQTDMDLSSLNFGGSKIADAPEKISSSDIPTAGVSATKGGRSI